MTLNLKQQNQYFIFFIIGPNIKLTVDANHAYDVPTAVTLAKKMEQFDISWFEEPVIPEDIDGYRRVKSQTSIPIAGGECSFMRYGFRDKFAGRNQRCHSHIHFII